MKPKNLEVRKSLFEKKPVLASLEDVKRAWQGCTKCKVLCENRKQVVFWDGAVTARVMAIGQWPGKDEDKEGVPFCGKPGELCRRLVHGDPKVVPDHDIFWTNVLGCRIPDDMNFRTEFMQNCTDLLETQISLVRPKLILSMGRVAMIRLSGKGSVTQEDMDGSEWKYKGIPVISIVHPAKILRAESERDKLAATEVIKKLILKFHLRYKELTSDING